MMIEDIDYMMKIIIVGDGRVCPQLLYMFR
jgi:hypothetical protein